MANANENPELEDPPLSLRSPVWKHFGFPVNYDNGQRQVDKTKAACSAVIGYASGNTSNLITHLKRHHPNVNITV